MSSGCVWSELKCYTKINEPFIATFTDRLEIIIGTSCQFVLIDAISVTIKTDLNNCFILKDMPIDKQ